jgi:diguanylate cyclase (GGDEF)-like protein/PAS domain S-box-containing protein
LSEAHLLYDSEHGTAFEAVSSDDSFTFTEKLELSGRYWTLRYTALPGFAATQRFSSTWVDLATLALVGMLVLGLSGSLISTRRRAETIAQHLTAELRQSQAFAQEVLNSVPEHIAVIDQLGTILAVNEAWRRFSRENSAVHGELAAATAVGANYLSICSSAGDDARATRAGIEAVLNGELPGFALEYPCHSPSEQRWFAMSVSPLQFGGQGAVIVHSNITARILAEQEIAQKTQRLSNIIWGTGVGTWEWNVQTGEARFNKRWAELIGYTLDELAPVSVATWMKYAHPDDLAASGAALEKHFAGEIEYYECEARMRHKDGHWVWVLTRARLVSRTPAGLPEWMAGTHTDIGARKQAQADLQLSEARLRAIIENEPECIKIVDSQGRLKQMNPAGLAMIEADSEGQVLDRPVVDLIAPEYRAAFADMHRRVLAGETVQMEYVVQGLKGGHRWLETHAVPMRENGETVQLAVTRDITKRHEAEAERTALLEEIRQLAFFDALTGLPNRRMLNDRLSQATASSKRSGLYGALMFLDLDNFKPLNDVHGHSVGDLLLVEVAKRLCACVREVDTVARLGGDEFVVMLVELDADKGQSTEQAAHVAEKVRASLAAPYLLTVAQPGRARHVGRAPLQRQHWSGLVLRSRSQSARLDEMGRRGHVPGQRCRAQRGAVLSVA